MLTEDDTIIDLKPEPVRSPRVVPVPLRPIEVDVVPQIDSEMPGKPPRMRLPIGRNRILARGALLLAMLCIAAVLGHWGHVLRDSLYEAFPMVRHHGDINNAFNQGFRVNMIANELATGEGWIATDAPVPWRYVRQAMVKRFDDAYDDAMLRVAENPGTKPNFDFDYVPLRLLVATLWVRDVRQEFPNATNWQDGFAFTRFMLHINTALGALTAIAMFLLVRHWVLRRAMAPPQPGPIARMRYGVAVLKSKVWSTLPVPPLEPALSPLGVQPPTVKAWALGFIAALLVWFEPNILVESHIWPQWDLWIVPFFVLAVWLASVNWWFAAGLSLGIGAMLKGQMLFGAPLLFLWAIFDLRPGALARLMTGFATSFLAIASPWLVQTREAAGLLLMSLGAAGVIVPFYWMKRKSWVFGVISAVAGIAVLTPFIMTRNWNAIGLGLGLVTLILAGPWLLPRRSSGIWATAVGCVAITLAAVYWGGSASWWQIGFGYGTRHYQAMTMGPPNNLAAVLTNSYGWRLYDPVVSVDAPEWIVNRFQRDPAMPPPSPDDAPPFVQNGQLVVTVKLLTTTIYVVLLTLCAFAAARHARRNDPRFLVAITAPWVIFFAVMVQMHERYLFWAAVIATCGIGVSLGMTLLWGVVSAMSVAMIVNCQLSSDPNTYLRYEPWFANTLLNINFVFERAHPGLGWAMVLLACIYLYMAVTSSRKSSLPVAA